METKVLHKTDEEILIQWSGDTGFGELLIKYDGKGGYTCDAEYIGFKTLFEIIKNTDLTEN